MISEIIRRARESAGLSREQLAELIGVNPRSVRRWESGETDPGLDSLRAVASALGCELVISLIPG